MAAKKARKKGATSKRPAKKAAAKKSRRAAARKPAAAKFQVVHWEIQAQNPKALHDFYSDVFGWKIDANNPMEYGMVSSGGPHGIDGGIGGTQGPGSRVLVYASVSSIPPVLKKIEDAGGNTIMPRTDVGPVIMALYKDPEGNMMGLIEG